MWLLSNLLTIMVIMFCAYCIGLSMQQRLFGVISRNLSYKHADRISFVIAFALTWLGVCVVLFITEKQPDDGDYRPHFIVIPTPEGCAEVSPP
jgi:hypothetical protein